MFYEPDKNDHGLPYSPFKAIAVPRPIAWVSSLSPEGRPNLAPFSQFNNLGYDPPYLMFSAGPFKDTVKNIVATGEFVVNMATWDLREEVNLTSRSVDPEVDEAAMAGLEMVPSRIVKPQRVARSPCQLECRLYSSVVLPGRTPAQSHAVIIGRVVGIHIRDDVIGADGKLDVLKLRPIARLGYYDYTSVESVFTMMPDGPDVERAKAGREGRPVVEGASSE
jgi:flavin reductase (DIM6/NTAB) family NADH-FMN oxidoreductase RutF